MNLDGAQDSGAYLGGGLTNASVILVRCFAGLPEGTMLVQEWFGATCSMDDLIRFVNRHSGIGFRRTIETGHLHGYRKYRRGFSMSQLERKAVSAMH